MTASSWTDRLERFEEAPAPARDMPVPRPPEDTDPSFVAPSPELTALLADCLMMRDLLSRELTDLRRGAFADVQDHRREKEACLDRLESTGKSLADANLPTEQARDLDTSLTEIRTMAEEVMATQKSLITALQQVRSAALSAMEEAARDGTYRADGRVATPERLSLSGLTARI